MVIVGSVKNFFFQKIYFSTTDIMSSSYNINTATVVPVIINLESILVDSDPEEDLKEIQCEAAAEQAQIKEAAQAKIAAACEHIKKK